MARREQHGLTNHPMYGVWCTIKSRCLNPNVTCYDNYGGRGISICEGWRSSFAAFFAAVGERPSPSHSLDRVDNDGGYTCGDCPECRSRGWRFNVQWATRTEQLLNCRRTIYVTLDGVEKPLYEWAKALGIPYKVALGRYNRTADVSRILNPVVRKRGTGKRRFSLRVLTRSTWRHIRIRCHNPKCGEYPRYGGRGLIVCRRWRDSFDHFLADMGCRPTEGHTIDRINNDFGYLCGRADCPDCGSAGWGANCRWATREQQNRNRRLGGPHAFVKPRRVVGVSEITPSPPSARQQYPAEWFAWMNMKQRCLNPNAPGWKRIGGAGVTVCERWRESFEKFVEDMGARPSPNHYLRRIDTAGPFSPDNCEWTDAAERHPSAGWTRPGRQKKNHI